jgi:acylglycerol lipase
MNLLIPITIIAFTLNLIGCASSDNTKVNSETDTKDSPFSFKELESSDKFTLPLLQYMDASDNTKLAYRAYTPGQVRASLILFHGGGAHSSAGYQHIGNGLSRDFDIAVFTPDIRGHGNSGGDRGDAPNSKQVLDDIGVFIRNIRKIYPDKPLFLAGHSSGAGLILNYSSFATKEKVSGYLFISPHLGFRSETEHENNSNPFAEAKTSLFVKNAIFGTNGNTKAVFFNYPRAVLDNDPKLISSITVNMSNALTPTSPGEQLKELREPSAVWIGKEDEVLDANKVIAIFDENNPKSSAKIIDKEKHLSILLIISNNIGSFLQSIVR